MARKFSLFLLILSTFLFACQSKGPNLQMYYWKQDFKLDKEMNTLLDTVQSTKIYTKFFDIDLKDGKTTPLAKVNFSTKPSQEIVPCIYITNRTFERELDLDKLAQSTFNLVKDVIDKNRLEAYSEIQFDCDWTKTTKNAYFQFLEAYRKLLPEEVVLNSTLRLHQLKYPMETGVPPVDRVCLMCYNVGNIKDINESNSIFQPKLIADYITPKTKYPLPMDLALPMFSWAVLYRFNKLSLILNNVDRKALAEAEFIKSTGNNEYIATENHYFHGNYLYKNDVLRYEDVPIDSLLKVMPLFEKLSNSTSDILLYELSNENILNYNYEDFEEIRRSYP